LDLQVSCLSSFNKLERLDLGYNCLVTLEVTALADCLCLANSSLWQ
jgi:hypothetical protein